MVIVPTGKNSKIGSGTSYGRKKRFSSLQTLYMPRSGGPSLEDDSLKNIFEFFSFDTMRLQIVPETRSGCQNIGKNIYLHDGTTH